MNPTSERCCDRRPAPHELPPPAMVANDFSNRIVNIAGIGPGDRVISIGVPGAAIETAVSARGALLTTAATAAATDRRRLWQSRAHPRADALLWAVNPDHQATLVNTLATLRHDLRTGGRLVLWMSLGGCDPATAGMQTIQRSIASAGFASVIVGRLAADAGDVLVATGILGLKAKQPT